MRFITQRNHCDSAVPGGSRESGLDQLCGVGSYVCMYVSTYTAGKHIRPDPCPLPGKNTFDAFNYCTVGSVAFRGRGMYDTFSKRQLASSVAPPWEENRSLNQRRISGMCIACTGRLGPGGGGTRMFSLFPLGGDRHCPCPSCIQILDHHRPFFISSMYQPPRSLSLSPSFPSPACREPARPLLVF